MNNTLILSTLLFATMSAANASAVQTQSISAQQAQQVATQVANQLLDDTPSLSFVKEKQTILSKLKMSSPNGICCKALYKGKLVKGGMMAAHGHAVCVPFAACGGSE